MPKFIHASIFVALTAAASLPIIFFGLNRGHYWLYGHTSYRNVDASLSDSDTYVYAVLQNTNMIHDYVNTVLTFVQIYPSFYIIFSILSRLVLYLLCYAFFKSLKFSTSTAVLSTMLLAVVAFPDLMTTINMSGALFLVVMRKRRRRGTGRFRGDEEGKRG